MLLSPVLWLLATNSNLLGTKKSRPADRLFFVGVTNSSWRLYGSYWRTVQIVNSNSPAILAGDIPASPIKMIIARLDRFLFVSPAI